MAIDKDRYALEVRNAITNGIGAEEYGRLVFCGPLNEAQLTTYSTDVADLLAERVEESGAGIDGADIDYAKSATNYVTACIAQARSKPN